MSVQPNTPAHTHLSISHAGTIIAHAISMIHEWRARSAMRMTLGGATDEQLRDVGLIRQDIEDACNLPLAQSAGEAIRTAARLRSVKW